MQIQVPILKNASNEPDRPISYEPPYVPNLSRLLNIISITINTKKATPTQNSIVFFVFCPMKRIPNPNNQCTNTTEITPTDSF